jgi:hypothetical protein
VTGVPPREEPHKQNRLIPKKSKINNNLCAKPNSIDRLTSFK